MSHPGGEEETQPNRYMRRYAKTEPFMDRLLLSLVNSRWSLAIVFGYSLAVFLCGVVVGR